MGAKLKTLFLCQGLCLVTACKDYLSDTTDQNNRESESWFLRKGKKTENPGKNPWD